MRWLDNLARRVRFVDASNGAMNITFWQVMLLLDMARWAEAHGYVAPTTLAEPEQLELPFEPKP